MKEATILLKLTKDAEVNKHHVTPVEAMLLVSEHHVKAGGNPVTVLKETVKSIEVEDEKDGKKIKRSRTIDEELDRLRGKYHSAKVGALSSQVREFPVDDFDKAIEMGIKVAMPTTRLSETKLV